MSLEAHTRKDGLVSYSYKFFYHGKSYRGPLGTVSKAVAQRLELQAKARIMENIPEPPAEIPTFNDYAPTFMAHVRTQQREQSIKVYRHRLTKHLLPFLGQLHLSELTDDRLEEYRQARIDEGGAPRTLNGELSLINVFLQHAITAGVLTDISYKKMRWLKGEKHDIRVLTVVEEERLLLAATPRLRPVIRFALQTGLTREELVKLTWGNVDVPHGQLRIVSSRHREERSRVIPLSTTAIEILDEVRSKNPDRAIGSKNLVFGYHSIAVVMDEAVKKARLPGVSTSTLRQTFARRCLDLGLNIFMVQRWLGHSSIRQMERYLPPPPQNERQAIEKLRKHFGSPSRQSDQSTQMLLV